MFLICAPDPPIKTLSINNPLPEILFLTPLKNLYEARTSDLKDSTTGCSVSKTVFIFDADILLLLLPVRIGPVPWSCKNLAAASLDPVA